MTDMMEHQTLENPQQQEMQTEGDEVRQKGPKSTPRSFCEEGPCGINLRDMLQLRVLLGPIETSI